MDEVTLFKFGIGSITASPTPKVKTPHRERGVVWVTWSFWGWSHSFNIANASTVATATPGVINSPKTAMVSVMWLLFKFQPLQYFWSDEVEAVGRSGKGGGMWATMLHRIPSLLLNDAWIYSQDAVLWHGMSAMSCFALPCYFLIIIFCLLHVVD